ADIDTLVGVSGGTIAADLGVDELHRLEAAVLLGALAAEEPSVIAAAASVVDDPLCRDILGRRSIVVVLRAGVDELMARIPTGDHRRSMPRDELVALATRREPLFSAIADVSLDASLPTVELVSAILGSPALRMVPRGDDRDQGRH
ncbi:MAG: hypothetical protein OEU32_18030, partial [Acidimicrobiia bacterium]|nr:hypothetical protein [Acidimicrobiia bacterium]